MRNLTGLKDEPSAALGERTQSWTIKMRWSQRLGVRKRVYKALASVRRVKMIVFAITKFIKWSIVLWILFLNCMIRWRPRIIDLTRALGVKIAFSQSLSKDARDVSLFA